MLLASYRTSISLYRSQSLFPAHPTESRLHCISFAVAAQIVQVVDVSATSESVLDLVDSTNENYGKCSVVYVGVVPTTLQKVQLDAYSIKFKVIYILCCTWYVYTVQNIFFSPHLLSFVALLAPSIVATFDLGSHSRLSFPHPHHCTRLALSSRNGFSTLYVLVDSCRIVRTHTLGALGSSRLSRNKNLDPALRRIAPVTSKLVVFVVNNYL